jgi:YD repeat-containing protein
MENDDVDVYTAEEYTFDSDGNLIKLRDNNNHIINYMTYDTYGNLSRMVVVNNETKKITPFSRTGKISNKTMHLYLTSEFEDKQISTEFVKYPFGYIKETTTVMKDGKELCSYQTSNGEDYKVGVLFDSLYK